MLRLAGRDQNRHPPDIFHLPRSQEIYHHQLWPTGDSTTTYCEGHKEATIIQHMQQVLPSFILTTWWSTHTFSPSDLWLEAGCTVNQQLSFMAPAHAWEHRITHALHGSYHITVAYSCLAALWSQYYKPVCPWREKLRDNEAAAGINANRVNDVECHTVLVHTFFVSTCRSRTAWPYIRILRLDCLCTCNIIC